MLKKLLPKGKRTRTTVLTFEIDKGNFEEVNHINPSAIPDLEKALVTLGPLPAGSYDEGKHVVYCVSIDYADFSIPDMIEAFHKFGLDARHIVDSLS